MVRAGCLIVSMSLLILLAIQIGCASRAIAPYEFAPYVNNDSKTRSELIAELRNDFEGKWFGKITPVDNSLKIERVTPNGFYQSKEEKVYVGKTYMYPDGFKYVQTRNFYSFDTPPLMEYTGISYNIICTTINHSGGANIINTFKKDEAMRLFGLLYHIYNTTD